jgi:hypothetical protein
MSGPSAHERGPSGPAAAGLIFNELPRHAPEPPHTAQTLNYIVGRSTYSDGQSVYNNGWSDHMPGQSAHAVGRSVYPTGRSCAELFKEDFYLNPHPSQQNFPSYPMAPQHHNTTSQAHGGEHFLAPPRRPKRGGQSYEPYRANSNAPQNPNRWGEDNN